MQSLSSPRIQRAIVTLMIALLMVATGAPVVTVAEKDHPDQGNDKGMLVQQLIQQATIIGPGAPIFTSLQAQFTAWLGLSGMMLAASFQSDARGMPQAYSGMAYYLLASAQGLDMRSVASGQVQSALLGVLQVPMGAHLGGVSLPGQLGVAVMSGSFVIVLIDLATGQIIAFILLPVSPILAVVFFPSFLVIQVVVGLILTAPTFLFPFPIPILFACPALPTVLPFNVQVGSGLPVVTVTNGSQPLFQISDGGFGVLRISSFVPSLSFSVMATGLFSFGLIIGVGSSQERIPFGTSFRLLVQGGGKTACIQAVTFSFGFGAILTGIAAHN